MCGRNFRIRHRYKEKYQSQGKDYFICWQKKFNIQARNTAKETWDKLEEAFEDKGLTQKVGLLKILTSVRLDNCSSIEEYLNKITMTVHQLKELDFDVKKEMIGALLLPSLPDKYQSMNMALENSWTRITADTIKVKLLQKVANTSIKKEAEQDSVFLTKAGPSIDASFAFCARCQRV